MKILTKILSKLFVLRTRSNEYVLNSAFIYLYILYHCDDDHDDDDDDDDDWCFTVTFMYMLG